MRKFRLIWLLVWLVASVASVAPAGAQTDAIRVKITQVDGSDFPAVRVFMSITDAQNQPVVGLQQSQLTITEDGKPVDVIDFVGSGSGSANTLLLIDHSGSMKDGKLEGAQAAATTFVDLMRPTDQVGLLVFDNDADLVQPLTNNQDALRRAIDRVRLGGGTALYDAVQEGVDVLRSVEGRRSLIVLSDGSDRDSRSSLGATISMVKRADLTINTIGLGDRSDLSEDELTELAASTGGTYFYAPDADQLATLYGSISEELKTEYSFTYRSPRAAYDGTQRNIGIQFSRGSETFGASSSYLEKHLLQLRSNAFVGTLLLLLLGLALAAPIVRQRRGLRPAMAAQATGGVLAADQPLPAASIPPQIISSVPASAPLCVNAQCRQPLRPGAKFCTRCGSRQS